MRDLKNALIACVCVVFLAIAAIAIWSVKQYLPVVGIILLVVLVVGALFGMAYVAIHLHHKFFAYAPIPIAQYGTVLHRRNTIEVIAPYHPPVGRQSRQLPAPADDYVEGELEDVEDMPALLPPVRSFAELLADGVVQAALAQGQIILGYNENHELRYGSWLDLYSCLIGGVSGSGKSTTVRFLLFQAALAGARFIFIDPHIGDEKESVAAQFRMLPGIHQMPPCDDTRAAVTKRITWLARELDRRKKTGIKAPSLIFVVDELNSLFMLPELKKDLAELLVRIGREGRKFHIFFMGIGQRFSQQDLGGAPYGAAVREAMASDLAHRFTSEDQAKKFIGSKHGPKCLELATGHWLFRDTNGVLTNMSTPDTRAEDGEVIARMMGLASDETPWKTRENTLQLPENTTTNIISIDPRNLGETSDFEEETTPVNMHLGELARQVVRLQANGIQKPDIMRQVWGVSPGGTEAYRQAQEEYQQVMAFIASQIGA